MLFRLHTYILISGLLSMGLAAVMVSERAYCLMTVGTVFAFITQLSLIMNFSQDEKNVFSEKTLFFTTLFYSAILGTFFMGLSYYYDGDTFMFSKNDAMFYFENSMKVEDIGLLENIKRLTNIYDFEDCGALVFDSLIMALCPSKYFLNAVFMLTGAISAVLIYRLGRYFMSDVYAFTAALAYGTSSFLIFFHCTFLKESFFVFLVVCAMYFFYKAIVTGYYWSYLAAILFVGLIMFFRPAVSAMLVLSFMIYFAISQHGSASSFFIYLIAGASFIVFLAKLQGMVDHYTGGDMDAMKERGAVENYSSGCTYLVSLFGGPFGPFPSLFPKEAGVPATLNFYGSGLSYRLFLVFPFWIGVYFTIKQRVAKLAPMVIYILVEMIATAMLLASLELRKVLLHIPFMFILTFYGLYEWEQCKETDKIRRIPESVWFVSAIAILVVWTVMR